MSTHTDFAKDIVDLYVTQDPIDLHLLEVDALNVEEDMNLIPSILSPQ